VFRSSDSSNGVGLQQVKEKDFNFLTPFGKKVSAASGQVSCQDGRSLRGVENGGYDFQIISFQDLKNARFIADTRTMLVGEYTYLQ
jgi:hypothetical protein